MNQELHNLAKKVGSALKEKELSIVTAESCTGGLLAATLTEVSGISCCFERGFVTYSNVAKEEDLGVKTETMAEFGVVSEEVVGEMAKGALQNSHAQISIAITGIAGPLGGSEDKPVGTVCFSLVYLDLLTKTVTMHFTGDRESIRIQAVKFAFEFLLEVL